MSKNIRRTLIALALTVVAQPAWTQTPNENLQKCMSGDPKIVLDGCTAVINSDQDTGSMAIAYFNRGLVYEKNGLNDQAIGDFTQAILVRSDLAVAYSERGTVYEIKGLHDQAVSDWRAAVKKSTRMTPLRSNT